MHGLGMRTKTRNGQSNLMSIRGVYVAWSGKTELSPNAQPIGYIDSLISKVLRGVS